MVNPYSEVLRTACKQCGNCRSFNVGVLWAKNYVYGIARCRVCHDCGHKWRTMESEEHYYETMKDHVRKRRVRLKHGEPSDPNKYMIPADDPVWGE